MELLVGLLIAVIVVLVVFLLIRAMTQLVTVHDYERGLRYRRGRFKGLVDPGTHLSLPPFTEVRILDSRPTFVTIEGQEVLTSDGVPLKVSLAARYVIGDPVAAVTGDQSFARALYIELQLGLREVLAAGTVDDALASRGTIGPAVLDKVASKLARVGIELLSVDVRDLMVPGDLKKVFAGVVAARKEGEASLERVRSETAALRNLANAGRMVEENPGLLQLRMLQHLGASSGNTVMLSMPDGQGSAVAQDASAARPRPAQGQRGRRASDPPTEA